MERESESDSYKTNNKKISKLEYLPNRKSEFDSYKINNNYRNQKIRAPNKCLGLTLMAHELTSPIHNY